MIVKKVKHGQSAKPKAWQIGDLLDYIRSAHRGETQEKVTHFGARNFLTDDHEAQKREMIALAQESIHSRMPVSHWIFSWREEEQPTPEQVEETEKAAAIMKMTEAQVRIVMSQNELREKAMIFNEGLDDRVIEIVKVLTLEQLNSQLQGKQLDAIYFDVHDGDYRFALFFNDQQGMVRIDIDAVRTYAANLKELLEETKQDMIIDRSWAKRFLDTH